MGLRIQDERHLRSAVRLPRPTMLKAETATAAPLKSGTPGTPPSMSWSDRRLPVMTRSSSGITGSPEHSRSANTSLSKERWTSSTRRTSIRLPARSPLRWPAAQIRITGSPCPAAELMPLPHPPSSCRASYASAHANASRSDQSWRPIPG
jgi:hypothetical protein